MKLPSVRSSARRVRSIVSDARHALRLLVRSPLFTATSVLSLAIGIASATTVFTLSDAVLFQSIPAVRDPSRVVDIEGTTNGRGHAKLSYPMVRYLRENTKTLVSMSAKTRNPAAMSLSDGAVSGRVYGATVSASFFDVLGVRPALGRFFLPDEDEIPEARPVAVLSHRFWVEHFSSDPAVLNRPIRLNNRVFAVVGVAEPGFDGADVVSADLWVPVAMAMTATGQSSEWQRAIGRLAPGVSRATAQAELDTLLEAFRAQTNDVPASFGIRVVGSGRLAPPDRSAIRAFIGLLSLLAGGLLAIACSNVAGMLLARATVRRSEMATRLAMGASQGQIMSQMLTETLVLFAAAGLLAIPLTLWFGHACEAFLPSLSVPVRLDLSMTGRAILGLGSISFLASVIFGLAPARLAATMDLAQFLHGRSTAGPGRLRLRHALVVGQVALSLAMVITAGLFVRAIQAAAHADPGFKTENVEIVSLDTRLAGAEGPAGITLVNRVMERLRAIPGIDVVASASLIPLQGSTVGLGVARVPGISQVGLAALENLDWDVVSPDYFRAVGLPIVAGRAFSIDDRAGRTDVAVVNETFARTAWPEGSALGRTFWQTKGDDTEGRPLEVVGVVKDAKYRTFDEDPRPFVYVPFEQQAQTRVRIYLKHAPNRSVARETRAAILSVDPALPVLSIQSFDEAAALGLLPQRLAARVAGVLGGIGMLLSALGLYGLTAFLVAQRTREIAIRMALGAAARDVRSMVISQAARLGLIGAILGMGGAVALGTAIQSLGLLMGVRPIDPVSFVVCLLSTGALLFLASSVPASRAASTDPAVALRSE